MKSEQLAQKRQTACQKERIFDMLRMLDGFTTEAVAQICICTQEQAKAALLELESAGRVRQVYEPMNDFVWLVVRN